MDTLKHLRKALKTALNLARILIIVATSIGILILLKYMGAFGLLCFIAGMAVMTALVMNEKTNYILAYLIKAVNGNESLLDVIRGEGDAKKEKENEWIDVGRKN